MLTAACGGSGPGEGRDGAAAASPAAPSQRIRSQCHEAGDVEHRLTRKDGGQTFAVSVGSGSRAVVLMPMHGADHCSWMPFARMIARQSGVQAWAVDSVGSAGESFATSADLRLVDDVVTAVDEARGQGATAVSLAGASMGGTTVLGAATRVGADRLVSLSAPWAYGGVDALVAAKRLDIPALIIVGEQDEPDFVDSAHRLVRAIPDGAGEYVGIVSSGHGTDLLGEEVRGRFLMDVLADYLTAPNATAVLSIEPAP